MRTKLSGIAAAALLVGIGIALGMAIDRAWMNQDAQAAEKTPTADSDAEPSSQPVKRVGQVIGLRPEMKDKYIELHANTWPSVLERIRKSNIRNYSIYLAELDGKLYLFSYYEYVGDDYEADMAAIAEDPETQRWWKETDPCQIRLPGTPEGEWWKPIPEVFHTN